MKYTRLIIAASIAASMLKPVFAEVVDVHLAPTTIRDIGGITQFNRSQYITLHESFGSGDLSEEDLLHIENELEAEFGRDGGLISWLANDIPADSKNPKMPDVSKMKDLFQKKFYENGSDIRLNAENMRNVILCTHPEKMHGHKNNKSYAWGPYSAEATAEYTAHLLKYGFTDKNRPRAIEVYNEPFVKAKKIPTNIEEMSKQHNVVAKRVKELNPDVMVGGYSAAWVEFESGNWNNWNNWQKKFMDIAGENMDFWSYHIYDGVNVMGTPRARTGSNSEAIMDIIDTYSHIKFGVAKPIMVTEYGQIPAGNMSTMPYSEARSAGMLYSALGQLMTFMDHPDRLIRTVPFILGKASWTYGMANDYVPGDANPYLLWRRLADGKTYVETDLTKFYYFWKGVKGEWRLSSSSNPDVRVHMLADNNRLNVIMMNLDSESKQIALNGLKTIKTDAVTIRSLTTHAEKPVLAEKALQKMPESLELSAGEIVMFQLEMKHSLPVKGKVKEHRIYATDYLQDIKGNQQLNFTFNGVPTGKGSATLRLSPARELGKQPLPSKISINGTPLALPTNWAGDNQKGRKMFYGMVELDIPMAALKEKSTVSLSYPDDGGKIASAVLQINRVEH
ncbi:beta-agarase [Algibacillus agarilyticus]|uniref:beta-agarase n=1 Tax=Algibacillus agarilyticus TaxID=2234133 RepID=UPI000DCFC354|nr:beta-agarase [Algibacillus agarilyticus]